MFGLICKKKQHFLYICFRLISIYSEYTIFVCGFEDAISCRIAFVPQRMNRNFRGTRCTACRRVSTLRMRQWTESCLRSPSTVTHGSAHRNARANMGPFFTITMVSRRGASVTRSVTVAVVLAASSLRTLIRNSSQVFTRSSRWLFTSATVSVSRSTDAALVPAWVS